MIEDAGGLAAYLSGASPGILRTYPGETGPLVRFEAGAMEMLAAESSKANPLATILVRGCDLPALLEVLTGKSHALPLMVFGSVDPCVLAEVARRWPSPVGYAQDANDLQGHLRRHASQPAVPLLTGALLDRVKPAPGIALLRSALRRLEDQGPPPFQGGRAQGERFPGPLRRKGGPGAHSCGIGCSRLRP